MKHPKVFNRLYFSMVGAGEKGGLLAEILSRLATYLENTARLRKKSQIRHDVSDGGDDCGHWHHHFSPGQGRARFRRIFSQFHGKLPAPTQYLIDGEQFGAALFRPYLALGAGAIMGGWLYYIKTPTGLAFWDAKRIKLPIFGSIAHKICLARFTRTMASLVRSGVPILEVLAIVQNTVGNVVMELAIKSAATDIERGEGISNALGKHPVFPTMIIRMMTAGEQTGKIDAMLERVADFLDEEIENDPQRPDFPDRTVLDRLPGRGGGRHRDLHVFADFQTAAISCPAAMKMVRARFRAGLLLPGASTMH